MAYTVAQQTALQEALVSGELEVSYEGKTVKYRSVAELERALAIVTSALEAAGSVTEAGPRTSYASFSRD